VDIRPETFRPPSGGAVTAVSVLRAMPALVVSQLVKSFDEPGGRREVLRGASLTIEPGELVALVGRSGSGKSTLLNLIAGIDRPSSGRIVIDDVEVSALGERARSIFRRRHVGFVFQFFNLIPTLTVEENVRLPLELGRAAAPADRARARDLLAAVGLEDRPRAFPDQLSGGEQQRVAIARALVHQPALLLADEPTGALDSETGGRVLQLLLDLGRGRRTTVLLVTHSAEVARAADRMLLVEDGIVKPRALPGAPL
jgi:putative ABC transport system ATP-binding protein